MGEFVETKWVKEPEKSETIKVDAQVAFNFTLLEYDLKIAIAEASVASLKQEKLQYAYDTNAEILRKQSKNRQ